MAKYRPDFFHFLTTNGDHCTGDAFKMGVPIDAKTVDLEWVPLIMFRAAEAQRGLVVSFSTRVAIASPIS